MSEATASAGTGWQQRCAEQWAQTVLRGLATPFPWGAAHQSTGPDDCDVTPWLLHPSFHGCLDWHSSAHMQWSAITLLEQASEHLQPATLDQLVAVLDERLTAEHCAVEAGYLRRVHSYERPYGWGWAALLAAAAATSSHPHAPEWAQATGLVAEQVFTNLLGWLPKLAYPVRTGTHDNTAFGLGLCLDAARSLGRSDVAEAVEQAVRRWFARDAGYPSQWEPSGNDFLSAALSEAHLMQRVLPEAEFSGWLAGFLPGLGGPDDTLLEVPQVLDRTDGKLVHLFGLALSRAWQLRLLAPGLDEHARRRIEQCTARQVSGVEAEITDGDFMSTHWLVSFALQAELAAPAPGAA